jgi:hypothetical protein
MHGRRHQRRLHLVLLAETKQLCEEHYEETKKSIRTDASDCATRSTRSHVMRDRSVMAAGSVNAAVPIVVRMASRIASESDISTHTCSCRTRIRQILRKANDDASHKVITAPAIDVSTYVRQTTERGRG